MTARTVNIIPFTVSGYPFTVLWKRQLMRSGVHISPMIKIKSKG